MDFCFEVRGIEDSPFIGKISHQREYFLMKEKIVVDDALGEVANRFDVINDYRHFDFRYTFSDVQGHHVVFDFKLSGHFNSLLSNFVFPYL